jgi:hypothetical protein
MSMSMKGTRRLLGRLLAVAVGALAVVPVRVPSLARPPLMSPAEPDQEEMR